MASLLATVRVRNFRSARDVSFAPGPLTALVGEASAGKSTLLRALWALLDPVASLTPADASYGSEGRITIDAHLTGGPTLRLEANPPAQACRDGACAPPVVFLPSVLRSDGLVAASSSAHAVSVELESIFRASLVDEGAATARRSDTVPALSLLTAVETCCSRAVSGVVFLIEEPELYLRPQAQRYLHRLLRALALAGNQVMYSTNAPTFLNVDQLGELALVTRHPDLGSRLVQPAPLPSEDVFRVASEFDAERSEVFLARAALLVEGRTEKLVFPFVFQALGSDPDREGISIVECGGKSNLPVFIRICEAAGVPFVVVHDRDAEAGHEPIAAERAVNALIGTLVEPDRTVVLEPDFETVAGLRGQSHKPERAWRFFASLPASAMPEPLGRAARLMLGLLSS